MIAAYAGNARGQPGPVDSFYSAATTSMSRRERTSMSLFRAISVMVRILLGMCSCPRGHEQLYDPFLRIQVTRTVFVPYSNSVSTTAQCDSLAQQMLWYVDPVECFRHSPSYARPIARYEEDTHNARTLKPLRQEALGNGRRAAGRSVGATPDRPPTCGQP